MPEELELPPLEELVAVPELLVPLEDAPLPPELPDDEPVAPLLDVELPPEPLLEDPDEPPLPEDPDAEPLLPEDPDEALLPAVHEGDASLAHPYAIGLARTTESVLTSAGRLHLRANALQVRHGAIAGWGVCTTQRCGRDSICSARR
jgi:hypothetical protein